MHRIRLEVSKMMERLALEQFKAWKDKGKRKPLLVTGVRQCGKTYLIRNFGETDYTYFKVYMSDVGLLRRKSNLNYRTVLEGNEAFIR